MWKVRCILCTHAIVLPDYSAHLHTCIHVYILFRLFEYQSPHVLYVFFMYVIADLQLFCLCSSETGGSQMFCPSSQSTECVCYISLGTVMLSSIILMSVHVYTVEII